MSTRRAPLSLPALARDAGLLAVGILAALPVVWLVWASFTPKEHGANTPWFSLHGWHAVATSEVWTWLVNSIVLSGLITVGTVLLCSAAGYALARRSGVGSRIVLGFLAATMMLPAQVLLPASYELMFHLGWLGSWAAVILPSLAAAFSIMLMRNAFAAVPVELFDAARIDGAGAWRTYWDVALPCVRPMASALTLMAFTTAWNSFLWPQVVLSDVQQMPLSVGIATLGAQDAYRSDYAPLMAGTVLAIVPPLALFAWLQKEFIAGLTQGAVKG